MQGMPSLTVDGARTRAAALTVQLLRRRPRPDPGRSDVRFDHHDRVLRRRPVHLSGRETGRADLGHAERHGGRRRRAGRRPARADRPGRRRTNWSWSRRCSTRNDGEGLHRSVDAADGLVYLYAMSFLDAAPRIFACFDQPDLKAPYRVKVTAPPEWIVLGNGAATQVSPGRWELAETKPLSTYFVTLVAGPYHQIPERARRHPARAGVAAVAGGARWTGRPRTSSPSPGRRSTSSTGCSGTATRSASTTRPSCPSSTPARWRTRAA